MDRTQSLNEQVRANLAKIDAASDFSGNRVWLTFYLSGPPEKLRWVAEALADMGWLNADGWEGAFLYPKVQADKTARAIVEVAHTAQDLCDAHDVEILTIDADTSPDVQSSTFVTLYRPD